MLPALVLLPPAQTNEITFEKGEEGAGLTVYMLGRRCPKQKSFINETRVSEFLARNREAMASKPSSKQAKYDCGISAKRGKISQT